MQIQPTSGLSEAEIQRMVREAEQHAAEDARLREQADLKNRSDNLAYTAEKMLRESGDRLPSDVKLEVEDQIQAVRQALKDFHRPGELARALGELRQARPTGLMTMARAGGDEREQRATFANLRDLRDRLQEVSGVSLPELSMGMTADAPAAVAEGATLVRVGTALFGPRPGH